MPSSRPEPGDGTADRVRPALHVVLLGEFELTEGGRTRALGKGARRIVALLAIERGGLSRARAAELLTPHLDPESARGSLRMELVRLRARVPADLIDDDGTTLRLAPHVTVDIDEVEALAARAAGQPDAFLGATEIERLCQELLPRWDDDWLVPVRIGLRRRDLNALDENARARAARGDRHSALVIAHRVLRIDRARESTVAVLIKTLLDQGNQMEAVRAYHDLENRLRLELDAPPSPQLRALVSHLLERT